MSKGAFHRPLALMAAISAIMSQFSGLEAQARIGALGAYRSRGHGKGLPGKRLGNSCNNAGHNIPHQGAQEIARRRHGGWAKVAREIGMTKRQVLGV